MAGNSRLLLRQAGCNTAETTTNTTARTTTTTTNTSTTPDHETTVCQRIKSVRNLGRKKKAVLYYRCSSVDSGCLRRDIMFVPLNSVHANTETRYVCHGKFFLSNSQRCSKVHTSTLVQDKSYNTALNTVSNFNADRLRCLLHVRLMSRPLRRQYPSTNLVVA